MKYAVAGAGLLAFALSNSMLAADDSWKEFLRHTGRNDCYTFALRSGVCLRECVDSVAADSIRVVVWTGHGLSKDPATTLLRKDVVQVRGFGDRRILFSDRSSWWDVRNSRTASREYLRLELRSGKSVRGLLADSSDSEVQLKEGAGTVRFAKADIIGVWYSWPKPMPSADQYFIQESGGLGILAILDPRTWPYVVHAPPHESVRLYDASTPEDNSPITCPAN